MIFVCKSEILKYIATLLAVTYKALITVYLQLFDSTQTYSCRSQGLDNRRPCKVEGASKLGIRKAFRVRPVGNYVYRYCNFGALDR